jgi:hypothetical protein
MAKCGLCGGVHRLLVDCPKLANVDVKPARELVKVSPNAPVVNVYTSPNTPTLSPNTSPNTSPNNDAVSPNRQARYRAKHIEQHRAYMREYMRKRREKKVPALTSQSRV